MDNKQKFEDKLALCKTISEMIKPIIKEREEEEREEEEREEEEIKDEGFLTITNEIAERRDKIKEIKKDKARKILTILGQMYNGVIIPEELSCRRGNFFKYKCHYDLSLNHVKEIMLKNLHIISEKINNSKNLDILEYCLNKWDKDNDKISESYYKRGDNRIKKDFTFDEIKVIEKTDNYRENNSNTFFNIIHINGVSVYDDGEIKFFYGLKDNKNELKFQTENFNRLYKKFEDDIKRLAKDFIKALDYETKIRTSELEEIKLKGSHLLMSAELQKGSDDVNGFGGK